MRAIAFLSWAACAFGSAVPVVASSDLQRARRKVPSDGARGAGHFAMTQRLNELLRRDRSLTLKPCEDFSVEELVELQRELLAEREPALESVYQDTSDNRRMGTFGVLAEAPEKLEKLFEEELKTLGQHPSLRTLSRDGKCHQAVMWMVHHVPASRRAAVAKRLTLPLLPEREAPHRAEDFGGLAPEESLGKVYAGYKLGIGCGACHDSDAASLSAAESEMPKSFPQALQAGKCCGSCEEPRSKYFSLNAKKGQCVEVCIQKKHLPEFKLLFQYNLTKAGDDVAAPCAAEGFGMYAATKTQGLGPLSLDGDIFAASGSLPLFPPPTEPFWPARFSAKTFGTELIQAKDPLAPGTKNYTSDWFYDWPNARHLYNGSETFQLANGTVYTKSYIRTWHGPTAKNPSDPVVLCDIDNTDPAAPSCSCSSFPKFLLSQVERPDGFVRAKASFAARENVSGSDASGTRRVDGVVADHFVGPAFPEISPAPFEIWQDAETNFPVFFSGPVGFQGDTGTRYFTDVRAHGESLVTPAIFDLDLSFCENASVSMEAPSYRLQGASLLHVMMARSEVVV